MGAKHTAVARLWPQRPGTRRTVVHDDTAIGRHDLVRMMATVWAGQRRVQVSHSTCPTTSCGPIGTASLGLGRIHEGIAKPILADRDERLPRHTVRHDKINSLYVDLPEASENVRGE